MPERPAITEFLDAHCARIVVDFPMSDSEELSYEVTGFLMHRHAALTDRPEASSVSTLATDTAYFS
jgi:hypothetical protein